MDLSEYTHSAKNENEKGCQPPIPQLEIEDFSFTQGIKLIHGIIQDLNDEQRAIVISIGFGSILQLSCSTIPIDVFNWLALHMNTTTGSIDLPNGFSFTINRESIHIILVLPMGHQPISFSSTPEIVRVVNMEIHGKDCTPTVFELAALLRSGVTGKQFTKAFMLLVNCLFLCPNKQSLPSSSYYNAIADESKIKDFDWCSFVLHWFFLSINKTELNVDKCFCCGLIPVIKYFEFLIAPGISLQNKIPRLSLWTDNVMKLYDILDSNGYSTFGALTVKHLCCTPFAKISQKRKVAYEMPIDVVNYIQSNYNPQQQENVRKRLKVLSTNLHDTILSSTARAVSKCVDEVLRTFCSVESSQSEGSELFFPKGILHCDDLVGDANVMTRETNSKQTSDEQRGFIPTSDPIISTRGMIKEMIYYYMQKSFPPFDEVIIDDGTVKDLLSTHDIFTALVQQLSKEPLVPVLGYIDVDEFLSKTLVKKLEISNIPIDETYDQMTMLDVCNFKTSQPSPVPEMKIDTSDWFVSLQKTNSADGFERMNTLQGVAMKSKITEIDNDFCTRRCSGSSSYGLSLNERPIGRSCPKTAEDNILEFPSYSLGVEFEEIFTPTPSLNNSNYCSNKHVSSNDMTDNENKKCHYYSNEQFRFQISPQYQEATQNEPSNACAIGRKNNTTSGGSECSEGKEWLDSKLCGQNQSLSFGGHDMTFSESPTTDFQSAASFGLSCKEHNFRPKSLKHVKSDNTLTPSGDSKMIFTGPTTHSFETKRPSAAFTRDYSAAIHLKFEKSESAPSTTKNKQRKVSFDPDSYIHPNERMNPKQSFINCTLAEEDLFMMLTSKINEIVFSYRIFEIEERWTDERTLARCMSNGGYINEYVMNCFVKMILFEQKMKDTNGEKIDFLKHISYSEISEVLMYEGLDLNDYKQLLTERVVGFRLEHAGLVHVPCNITKQWFLVVANFMDQTFDVLNPSHNLETISDSINTVV